MCATATGTYVAGPLTLTAVGGYFTMFVKGAAGVTTLALSGGNTALSKIDTATVTIS